METKHYLKSKTIDSLLIVIVICILNIIGVGEAEPGKTWDTMLEMEGRQKEQIKNLLLLGGAGGAAYGRTKANSKLRRKKRGD